MIKCKEGTITISGYVPVVKAELSTLLQCMREKYGDAFVDECVEDSKKTLEELEEENRGMVRFISSLSKMLNSIETGKDEFE